MVTIIEKINTLKITIYHSYFLQCIVFVIVLYFTNWEKQAQKVGSTIFMQPLIYNYRACAGTSWLEH